MSNSMSKVSGSLAGKSPRQLKILLGMVAGLSIGFVSHALGQEASEDGVDLYTTTSDFTGWSNDNSSQFTSAPAASAAWDWDGDTVNGLGNNPGNSASSANPGGTSPGGSLQLSLVSPGTGGVYGGLTSSPGIAYDNTILQAIDPGAIPAYSAQSSFGPGATVPASGSIILTYTIATGSVSYEDMGISLNYSAGGYYNPQFADASAKYSSFGGFTTVTKTIPYSIVAGSLTDMHIQIFGNYNIPGPTSPVYVDDIELQSVPEPATLGTLGAGLALLTLRRRRAATI